MSNKLEKICIMMRHHLAEHHQRNKKKKHLLRAISLSYLRHSLYIFCIGCVGQVSRNSRPYFKITFSSSIDSNSTR